MCFGEFEWQTNAIIEHQINVNLFGTMNLTRSFLPLARKHRTRIINVTSHCALEVNCCVHYVIISIFMNIYRGYQDLPHMQPQKLVSDSGMILCELK